MTPLFFFVKNLIFFLPLQNLLFYYDSEQSAKPTGVIFLEVRLPIMDQQGTRNRIRSEKGGNGQNVTDLAEISV